MESKQIILSGLTPEGLVELFRPVLRDEIKLMKSEQEERLLSPSEACKVFQPPITKPTLKAWSDKGYLQEHRIGGRVFYKQSEILDNLQTLKKYKVA